MLTEITNKKFENGIVYALKTHDGFPIEVTDTFLPFYTKDAVGRKQNKLDNYNIGSREERWMIGISVCSGCNIGCKFCATGNLKRYRKLTTEEIIAQVEFILAKHPEINWIDAQEHKINITRMGDTFSNIDNVRKAIEILDKRYPNTHFFVSTIGIKGSDFSWIKDNITLQLSLHSLDETRRNKLIPFNKKMSIEELGKVRTKSNLKTTINMTMVDIEDFNIEKLRLYFDPKYFFIKVSPINVNSTSITNHLGKGIIQGINLL